MKRERAWDCGSSGSVRRGWGPRFDFLTLRDFRHCPRCQVTAPIRHGLGHERHSVHFAPEVLNHGRVFLCAKRTSHERSRSKFVSSAGGRKSSLNTLVRLYEPDGFACGFCGLLVAGGYSGGMNGGSGGKDTG